MLVSLWSPPCYKHHPRHTSRATLITISASHQQANQISAAKIKWAQMTILFWIQDLTARSNSECWGSDQVLFLFRCSNVDDKPGSASSRKEKGGDGFKSPDLVEVKTGAYTKKCVLPTLLLSIILSGLAGAGIFFLTYYFTVEFCEYSHHQLSNSTFL